MNHPAQQKLHDIEKQKVLHRLQEQRKYVDNLPHLYGFKFYRWAREFFESRNPMLLLVAGNQLSKSSTQIRKCIHWATATELWGELWDTSPRQFWYLYPSMNVATAEVETKWIPEFLPKAEMQNHPKYGWRIKYQHGQVHYIEFNSGVRVYFHAYSKDVHKMQSGTVHAIFTDEELPVNLYQELSFRVAAVNGFFSMVFTATKGQELWYRAMERIGKKDEAFKQAHKIRATAYDCVTYEDGDGNTPWTIDKINRVIATCATENEVLKRVKGRFIVDEGRKYPEFTRRKNVVPPYEIPKDWLHYGAADIGSGGKSGHKGAITFIAVRPDFKKGAIYRGWKGNNKETTTSQDILEVFRSMRGNKLFVAQYYDWASKDFHTYASRLGEAFQKAEKGHDIGEGTMNTLFKNCALEVFDIEENEPLIFELTNLTKEETTHAGKKHADDDSSDSCRYTVTGIPWDFTGIAEAYKEPENKKKEVFKSETQIRREMMFPDKKGEEFEEEVQDEIDSFNEMFDEFA